MEEKALYFQIITGIIETHTNAFGKVHSHWYNVCQICQSCEMFNLPRQVKMLKKKTIYFKSPQRED